MEEDQKKIKMNDKQKIKMEDNQIKFKWKTTKNNLNGRRQKELQNGRQQKYSR